MLDIQKDFRDFASVERQQANLQWFKQDDNNKPNFLGVMHGSINDMVKKYHENFKIEDLNILLSSEYHEERMLGIKMAMKIFNKSKTNTEKQYEIFTICFNNKDYFNQWDLIDTVSINIFGYFLKENTPQFVELSNSTKWEYIRMLLVSQLKDVRKDKKIDLSLKLAQTYFSHGNDLIQKAVGWVLKECYEYANNPKEVFQFIRSHQIHMSKLSYRIASEKF